jgi:hypothetical protein
MNNQPCVSRLGSPSVRNSYMRRAQQALGTNWPTLWTQTSQGAECLYLIVSTMRDGDKSALDFFFPNEIGDVDGDGMNEILDGWGNPIEFLRWAPGYCEQPGPDGKWGQPNWDDDGDGMVDNVTEAGLGGALSDDILIPTLQTRNPLKAPDTFDPLRVGMLPGGPIPYALYPLIISAGRDREFDVLRDNFGTAPFLHYADPALLGSTFHNAPNPYSFVGDGTTSYLVGTPGDVDSNGKEEYADNITNHYQQTP